MHKLVLAASLVAALVLAACGSATPPPSQAVVSPPPASPAPSIPTDPATPEPADPTAEPPVATPAPTPKPTAKPTPKPTPRPTAPSFNRAERYLIDGIMRGESDCSPVRSKLPARAIAGIDCDLVGSPVARVGYYLFRNEADLLDAYLARMEAEGIALESGGCLEGRARAPTFRGVMTGSHLIAKAASSTARATVTTAPPCPAPTSMSDCSVGPPTRAAWTRGPGSATKTCLASRRSGTRTSSIDRSDPEGRRLRPGRRPPCPPIAVR